MTLVFRLTVEGLLNKELLSRKLSAEERAERLVAIVRGAEKQEGPRPLGYLLASKRAVRLQLLELTTLLQSGTAATDTALRLVLSKLSGKGPAVA